MGCLSRRIQLRRGREKMQKSHTVGISGCERERVSGLGRCARQGTRPWRLCDPGKEQSGVVSEGRFWERNAA